MYCLTWHRPLFGRPAGGLSGTESTCPAYVNGTATTPACKPPGACNLCGEPLAGATHAARRHERCRTQAHGDGACHHAHCEGRCPRSTTPERTWGAPMATPRTPRACRVTTRTQPRAARQRASSASGPAAPARAAMRARAVPAPGPPAGAPAARAAAARAPSASRRARSAFASASCAAGLIRHGAARCASTMAAAARPVPARRGAAGRVAPRCRTRRAAVLQLVKATAASSIVVQSRAAGRCMPG